MGVLESRLYPFPRLCPQFSCANGPDAFVKRPDRFFLLRFHFYEFFTIVLLMFDLPCSALLLSLTRSFFVSVFRPSFLSFCGTFRHASDFDLPWPGSYPLLVDPFPFREPSGYDTLFFSAEERLCWNSCFVCVCYSRVRAMLYFFLCQRSLPLNTRVCTGISPVAFLDSEIFFSFS